MHDYLESITYRAACIDGYVQQMSTLLMRLVSIADRYATLNAGILVPFFFHTLIRFRLAVPNERELFTRVHEGNQKPAPIQLFVMHLRNFLGDAAVKLVQPLTAKGYGPYLGFGHALCFSRPWTRPLRKLFPPKSDVDGERTYWSVDDHMSSSVVDPIWLCLLSAASKADAIMLEFVHDKANEEKEQQTPGLRFQVWTQVFNLALRDANFTVPVEDAPEVLYRFYSGIIMECINLMREHATELKNVTKQKKPSFFRQIRLAYEADKPEYLVTPAQVEGMIGSVQDEAKKNKEEDLPPSITKYSADDIIDQTIEFCWDPKAMHSNRDLTDPSLHDLYDASFHVWDDTIEDATPKKKSTPTEPESHTTIAVFSSWYLQVNTVIESHWAPSQDAITATMKQLATKK